MFGDALCHLGIELGELVQQRSAPRLKLVSLGAPRSPCLGFGDLARLQPGHQHLRAVTSEGYVFDCLPAAFGSGDTTGSRPLPCCRQPASQRPGSPAPARWAGRHHVWIKIKNPACEAVKREAEEDGPMIDGKTRTP